MGGGSIVLRVDFGAEVGEGCSLPGSSTHGIFQARVLEWVPSPGNLPDLLVSCIIGRRFTI